MYTGLIASRYASALAEFSAANGDEERTYDEVRRLIGLYRRDRSLRDVLFSPVVGDEAKLEVLRGAMDDVLIDASVAAQLKLLRRKLGCKPNRIV